MITRFRADPKLVRVAIRKSPWGWYIATVGPRDRSSYEVIGASLKPENAIMEALESAENVGIPGVDLGMWNAYEHPWKTE